MPSDTLFFRGGADFALLSSPGHDSDLNQEPSSQPEGGKAVLYNEEKTALSRRAFVGKVTAGAVVAWVAGAGRAKAMLAREEMPKGSVAG
jgi:hypothetical protein